MTAIMQPIVMKRSDRIVVMEVGAPDAQHDLGAQGVPLKVC